MNDFFEKYSIAFVNDAPLRNVDIFKFGNLITQLSLS
jgi:hypothetical protein